MEEKKKRVVGEAQRGGRGKDWMRKREGKTDGRADGRRVFHDLVKLKEINC